MHLPILSKSSERTDSSSLAKFVLGKNLLMTGDKYKGFIVDGSLNPVMKLIIMAKISVAMDPNRVYQR